MLESVIFNVLRKIGLVLSAHGQAGVGPIEMPWPEHNIIADEGIACGGWT
jgi:hypothetical protein